MKTKLEIIGTKEFAYYEEMYKVIDFLNKNLSNKDIVFGLAEKNGKHIVSIYKEND